MNASEQVVWRQHPTRPKWHAFAPTDALSACGLTTKAVGEARPDVPPWPDACWRCCQALGVKTGGTRPPAPREPEPEPMGIEFRDGPFDGVRVRDLQVVRHDATHFTIVGQESYTIKGAPTMASEVEQPTTKEPWQS
jgi:hypothetical protein